MQNTNFSESEYLEFLPEVFLKRGSIHQIAGPSRFIFALIIARTVKDEITWIRREEYTMSLYPDGLTSWIDISKLILVGTMADQESVWVMEEFLKSKVSELIVCELQQPIQYSSLRRLILSFKKVREERNAILPTILLVSSFKTAIIGVESRWYMRPSALLENRKDFLLEKCWDLVCSKSRFNNSSWIIKSRQQTYNKRGINVYKSRS